MKKNLLLVFGALLFITGFMAAQPVVGTTVYDIPDVYIYEVPEGYVINITVQAWGGGGGGGSGTGSQGGGGGGGYITRTYTNVPAGFYIIVVGAGGVPGVDGNDSSFDFTGIQIAPGGQAGTAGATDDDDDNNGGQGGDPSGPNTSSNRTGGDGGGNNPGNGGGGGGGSGPSAGDGGNGGSSSGGSAGAPGGGAGGNDSNTSPGNNGQDATGPGGGGGGKGVNGAMSGTGGNGQVIITITLVKLPVTLAAFTGDQDDGKVSLKWETSSELNNEKFIIETSVEGEVFNRIGEIAGAGTSTEAHHYQFTHHTPSEGVNYYRLKQVDFDGTFEYSKVIAVNAPGSQDIFAFPNPAKDKINLQYDHSKGSSNIQLFDAQGRTVNANIKGYAGNYEVKLPDGLAKGMYWLKVERSGKIKMLPVMKE
jgi:Secretion system C-terminal sorting domain